MSKKRWESLWEPLPFFTMHKHYLQVTIAAVSEDDRKAGRVGAPAPAHAGARGGDVQRRARGAPYPEKKKDPNRDPAMHCVYYLGLGPAPPPSPAAPAPRGTLNLNPAVEQFQMLVTNWVNRSDGTLVWQPGMEVSRSAREAQGRPGVGERYGERYGRGEDRGGSGGGCGGEGSRGGGGDPRGGGGGSGRTAGGRGEAQIPSG